MVEVWCRDNLGLNGEDRNDQTNSSRNANCHQHNPCLVETEGDDE